MADYLPPEKKIFSFHNGEKVVWEDPVALYRRLVQAAAGRLNQLSRDAAPAPGDQEESPVEQLRRCEARENLLAVIRQAFKLPAWDSASGKGTLDADCWRMLREFREWKEKNEKPAGN